MRALTRTLVLLTIVAFSLLGTTLSQNMMLRSYAAQLAGSINRGDFNNDGIPDLAFCSTEVGVALTDPDGTLQPPRYSGTNPCYQLTVADFNRDGRLDIAVASYSDTDIYLGNGDGTFITASALPMASSGVIAGDFNGDGIVDLAVAPSMSTNQIFIYPGAGDGTFGPAISVPTQITYVRNLRIGDFDGDGLTDIAVSGATSDSSQVEVLFNNGEYRFQDIVAASGNAVALLDTADINQDTYTDLLVEISTNCVPNPKNQNCDFAFQDLLSSGRARTFIPAYTGVAAVNSTFGINNAIVSDVNGDGINDVVATLVAGNAMYAMAVWNGHPDGTFDTNPAVYDLGGDSSSSALVEFDANRDGRPDFAVINGGDWNIGLSVLLNAVPQAPCATNTARTGPTICQPTTDTYSNGDLHVVANGFDAANAVTAMQVYVDNQLASTVNSPQLGTYLTLPPGDHYLAFKQWNTAGASAISRSHVTVYSGSPGQVCSAAYNSAQICSPVGTTVSGTVHILAAGYTPNVPTAVELYIDNQLVEIRANAQNYIDSSYNLSPGSHYVVFKVWGANGNIVQASKTVFVL